MGTRDLNDLFCSDIMVKFVTISSKSLNFYLFNYAFNNKNIRIMYVCILSHVTKTYAGIEELEKPI